MVVDGIILRGVKLLLTIPRVFLQRRRIWRKRMSMLCSKPIYTPNLQITEWIPSVLGTSPLRNF